MSRKFYTGRFAPSPTGPLHFGSLVAAAASYLDARAQNGRWLVRMEDLDIPRVQAGAAADILRTLEAFGFEWDGEVVYQSDRTPAYEAALEQLRASGHVYPCGCTRREIADTRYAGRCRDGLQGREPRAWRVRTTLEPIEFVDRLQGLQTQRVEDYCGDFVVLRADGLFAYQLAVVVDDAFQNVTDVVRGTDLLDSTARQIHLQRLLGLPTPSYLHTPVAVNATGEKLSKQSLAPAIPVRDTIATMQAALEFLGQPFPAGGTIRDIWRFAIEHWNPSRIPPAETVPAPPRFTQTSF